MRLKFTTRGRAALVNAAHTGTKAVTVTQIGVTDRAFTPDPAGGDLALPGERKRLTTFGGKAVADDVVHLTVRDESDDSYPLRGIALYLEDGTLLAIYGGSEVILEKSSQAMMLLAVDWILADMDAKQIQFGNTDFLNPPATTEVQGVVELTTTEEAIAGKDDKRAVTPSALLATLDARLGKAAPSVLGKAIIGRGDAADVRTDLGLRSAALKDEGSGKGLDADSVDGKHATDFAAKQHTHTISDITDLAPARLLPAGLVAYFPTASPPEGWLRCNGADVSRTTYAALFAVIGTTFGSASGSTFRLPARRQRRGRFGGDRRPWSPHRDRRRYRQGRRRHRVQHQDLGQLLQAEHQRPHRDRNRHGRHGVHRERRGPARRPAPRHRRLIPPSAEPLPRPGRPPS
ncbi:tail fiber protein [Stenotrophomonas maltophilia]|uniref:Tail fiber protein n=1 Tax=Stenotrophomonas maltophilia TaxID=40324 RepID=A0A431UM22_STEMA|nr:tail fiber protein [Stenotrophomonas maltophilia]